VFCSDVQRNSNLGLQITVIHTFKDQVGLAECSISKLVDEGGISIGRSAHTSAHSSSTIHIPESPVCDNKMFKVNVTLLNAQTVSVYQEMDQIIHV
jgi:hypothetical protein